MKKSANTKAAGFSAEEKAAMRARQKELQTEARQNANRAEGEKAVLTAIAAMSADDRAIGERLHAIITKNAPDLSPKTWYGMPAYAKDGNVVSFFQCAGKFKARYATLGFSDKAKLDDGRMWPTAFAITELTDDSEERIAALVRQAAT